jgi:hypothetical protein
VIAADSRRVLRYLPRMVLKASPEDFRERLTRLREALLALHKALVDSERVSYEQNIGTIPSANHFLKLLTDDPWFAWLQPLSQLIVTMDEALDAKAKTPLTAELAAALVKRTAELLVAAETGESFPRHYFDALQRDPDVVMAHAGAAKWFRPCR